MGLLSQYISERKISDDGGYTCEIFKPHARYIAKRIKKGLSLKGKMHLKGKVP